MLPHNSLLLLITFWASVQDGSTLPILKEPGIEVGDVSTHHVRTKRCACSNQLDSECHYFCHLDIIWINTPSKTTTYGLGGSSVRSKRSTSRCTCARGGDQTCTTFCRLRSEIKPMKQLQINISMLSVENMTQVCKHIMKDEEDRS